MGVYFADTGSIESETGLSLNLARSQTDDRTPIQIDRKPVEKHIKLIVILFGLDLRVLLSRSWSACYRHALEV